MSVTLARLRALQRQAGRAEHDPKQTAAPAAGAVEKAAASGSAGQAGAIAPGLKSRAQQAGTAAPERVAAPAGHAARKAPATPGRHPGLQRLPALQQQAGRAATGAAGESATGQSIGRGDAASPSRPIAVADAATAAATSAHAAGAKLAAGHSADVAPRSVFDWIDRDAAAAPATPARGRSPDLAALRRLIGLRERTPGAAPPPGVPVDRTLPGREIAPGLHLIESFRPQPIPLAALSLAFARRTDEAVDPRDLLFFDTETTGLAGGTGTRAFMVGAADWHVDPRHGEGLRIRQLLIATMAAEPAMLREFAGWLAPRTVLSSYNGRCYDAPLLKTRYRLARLAEPLGALDHVDLLFPTRRRYRGTWENCRLATIERQLLRIVREDDLPGSEAPAAWLGFLRGGSARNLRRVADHNHQDVVTLALLFQRLVQAEAEEREVLLLGEGR